MNRTLLKVVKGDLYRYIRTEQLTGYELAGWTLEEELEIVVDTEAKVATTKSTKVKVAQGE